MGGTDLFGWMEKNHFDKDGARFIMEVAKNDAGLVMPGCQPVYNPMFGQWLHKNKKMFADLKKWMAGIPQDQRKALCTADGGLWPFLYHQQDDGEPLHKQIPARCQ